MVLGGFRASRVRGNLLLDCGGSPGKWLFYLNAVIFFVGGLVAFTSGRNIERLGGGSGVVFAFYWVFMANTKLAL
jgi:hypothetical protein